MKNTFIIKTNNILKFDEKQAPIFYRKVHPSYKDMNKLIQISDTHAVLINEHLGQLLLSNHLEPNTFQKLREVQLKEFLKKCIEENIHFSFAPSISSCGDEDEEEILEEYEMDKFFSDISVQNLEKYWSNIYSYIIVHTKGIHLHLDINNQTYDVPISLTGSIYCDKITNLSSNVFENVDDDTLTLVLQKIYALWLAQDEIEWQPILIQAKRELPHPLQPLHLLIEAMDKEPASLEETVTLLKDNESFMQAFRKLSEEYQHKMIIEG